MKDMKLQHKHLIYPVIFTLLAVPALQFFTTTESVKATTYSPYCTSKTCRDAADREAAAQKKADELSSQANTLQGKVDSLNAEIAAVEAEIASYEAIAKDLAKQIKVTEAKLEKQQQALVDLTVEMHLNEDPDAITILASSDNLGDFTERKTRKETVQEQVVAAAKEVRRVKEDLAQKKASNDAIITSKSSKRAEIAQKRNEQNTLIANYKDNADAYSADAEKARKIKAEEINKAIRASNNYGAVANTGADANGNYYPYRGKCPGINLAFIAYGGYVCQCTSYAGYMVAKTYGYAISAWGNASNWGNSAIAHGFRVDNNPAPGTVAYSTAGAYGHVMWVEAVHGSTITLSEYNYVYGDFSRRSGVPASAYRYIHFN